MEQNDDFGYIYCLSNESYKDTYKIGFTKNDPQIRMSQLNTTGILYPFRLEFAKQVKNHQDKEKKLHLIFDKYRVNKSREFFKIELNEIKQLFDLIDGEWYKTNNPKKESIKLNTIYKSQPVISIISSEKTISTCSSKSNSSTYGSTYGVNMQHKPQDIKKNIQSIEISKTHCSRCFDKLDTSVVSIKCKHNDICKYCMIQLKECPKCKTLYNKN